MSRKLHGGWDYLGYRYGPFWKLRHLYADGGAWVEDIRWYSRIALLCVGQEAVVCGFVETEVVSGGGMRGDGTLVHY
jgi:hypothetical protein